MNERIIALPIAVICLVAVSFIIAYDVKNQAVKQLMEQIEQRDTAIKNKQALIDSLSNENDELHFLLDSASSELTSERVNLTYYTLQGKTATGRDTAFGMCAVSRDLEDRGFKMGRYVKVEGYGSFLIADRTHKRIRNTIDIWMPKGTTFASKQNVKVTLETTN